MKREIFDDIMDISFIEENEKVDLLKIARELNYTDEGLLERIVSSMKFWHENINKYVGASETIEKYDDNIENIDELTKLYFQAYQSHKAKEKLEKYQSNKIELSITFPWTQYGLYTKYRNREITSHLKASLSGKKYRPRKERMHNQIKWPPEIPNPISAIKSIPLKQELKKYPDFGDARQTEFTMDLLGAKIVHIVNKDETIKKLVQKVKNSEIGLQEVLDEESRVTNTEHELYCKVNLLLYEETLKNKGKSININELKQRLLTDKNITNAQAVENTIEYFEKHQEEFKNNPEKAKQTIRDLEYEWQNALEQKDFLTDFKKQYFATSEKTKQENKEMNFYEIKKELFLNEKRISKLQDEILFFKNVLKDENFNMLDVYAVKLVRDKSCKTELDIYKKAQDKIINNRKDAETHLSSIKQELNNLQKTQEILENKAKAKGFDIDKGGERSYDKNIKTLFSKSNEDFSFFESFANAYRNFPKYSNMLALRVLKKTMENDKVYYNELINLYESVLNKTDSIDEFVKGNKDYSIELQKYFDLQECKEEILKDPEMAKKKIKEFKNELQNIIEPEEIDFVLAKYFNSKEELDMFTRGSFGNAIDSCSEQTGKYIYYSDEYVEELSREDVYLSRKSKRTQVLNNYKEYMINKTKQMQ